MRLRRGRQAAPLSQRAPPRGAVRLRRPPHHVAGPDAVPSIQGARLSRGAPQARPGHALLVAVGERVLQVASRRSSLPLLPPVAALVPARGSEDGIGGWNRITSR